MAVREFDGVDDVLRVSAGLAGVTTAVTMAAVVRRLANATQDDILTQHDAGAVTQYGILFSSADVMETRNAASSVNAISVTASSNWLIAVSTKAAGTATPRHHVYSFDTPGWTHTNASGTLGDVSGTVNNIRFMAESGAGFHNGRLAVSAIWDVAMTDTQVEELSVGLHTAAWWRCSAGRPKGLWEFNQAATTDPVLDLSMGGANQTAITGTTVSTDHPPQWVFDGITLNIWVPHAMPSGV